MSKVCIACGMLMQKDEDFAMKDPKKDYCTYCARPDGSMQSFDEKLRLLTRFLVKTQGLDPSAAAEMAKSMMAKLPAWKARFSA